MKICVMGAGAVGGYFGGKLALNGNDVSFIARGDHLEVLKKDGLKVESTVHEDFQISVKATDDPGEIGTVDLVLFTVKAYDTEQAGEQIRPLIGSDTTILSLQNGIDNEKILSEMYGEEKVVGGVAYILSRLKESGIIHHESLGRIEIGELDGEVSERLNNIKKIFEDSGIGCSITTDITKVLWRKLAFNCGLNAITALTESSLDVILNIKESREVFRSSIKEALKVGIASGVEMDEDKIIEELMEISNEAGPMKSSMFYDRKKGKELELDPINGKIIEMGNDLGIETPVNKTLYGCLRIINQTETTKE
ncbi:MAG: ketopantoate reductase family protein [Thermoplasmata archaeon]